MAFEHTTLTTVDGVSRLTINRPPMNTISAEVVEELLEGLKQCEADEASRCVVLSGAGTKAFSAGADIKGPPRDAAYFARSQDLGRALVDYIEAHPKPIVGAIRGWCVGGGFAIAMACDVRLISTSTKMRTPDAYSAGSVPAWGMSLTRLAHFIGRNRSLDLLMLGEDIDPMAALNIGLVTSVTPEDQFDAEVERVAKRLASAAPIVLRAIKEGVKAQYWHSPAFAREVETRWADFNSRSEDRLEARRAFNEKRTPVYKGR